MVYDMRPMPPLPAAPSAFEPDDFTDELADGA
jgi:hypothetical protein